MKKKALLHILLPFGTCLLGLALAATALYFGYTAPEIAARDEENAALTQQVEALTQQTKTLTESETSLKQVVTDTTKQRDDLQKKYENVMGDVAEKEKQIAAINKKVSDAQKKLSKAQRGVATLSQLDDLFVRYDKQSLELNNILNDYYTALENNDLNTANAKALAFNSKAEQAESTYQKITNLLKNFRSGNY